MVIRQDGQKHGIRLTVKCSCGILAVMKAAGKKIRDIEAFINKSPELADARENGVDLWALWHNLQRTPAERMRRHDMAVNTMEKLRKAKML